MTVHHRSRFHLWIKSADTHPPIVVDAGSKSFSAGTFSPARAFRHDEKHPEYHVNDPHIHRSGRPGWGAEGGLQVGGGRKESDRVAGWRGWQGGRVRVGHGRTRSQTQSALGSGGRGEGGKGGGASV